MTLPPDDDLEWPSFDDDDAPSSAGGSPAGGAPEGGDPDAGPTVAGTGGEGTGPVATPPGASGDPGRSAPPSAGRPSARSAAVDPLLAASGGSATGAGSASSTGPARGRTRSVAVPRTTPGGDAADASAPARGGLGRSGAARLGVVAVVVAGGLLGVTLDRRDVAPEAPVFGTAVAPVQPVVPPAGALTSSWYCPGVPAPADASTGSGRFVIANPGATALSGTLTVFPSEGEPVSQPVEVPARGKVTVDPVSIAPAPYVAGLFELVGSGAVVEQVADTTNGTSAAACVNAASPTWFLASGATTADAGLRLLALNPFPDDAIVDVTFATEAGVKEPQAVQAYVVPARTLKVITVEDLVRREPRVSASVVARTGRVVVGRVQSWDGQLGVRGAVAGPLSPATGSSWWFADGLKAENVVERFSVYNPTDQDAEVDVSVFPTDPPGTDGAEPISITVPSRDTVVVETSSSEAVPAGRHSAIVASQDDVQIVVEQTVVLTGTTRKGIASLFGSLITGPRWDFALDGGTFGAPFLAVANATGQEDSVTVRAVGPNGPRTLPGLSNVRLPAAGGVRFDLSDKGVDGQALEIVATGPVVVYRQVLAGDGVGLSWSLGLPLVDAGDTTATTTGSGSGGTTSTTASAADGSSTTDGGGTSTTTASTSAP